MKTLFFLLLLSMFFHVPAQVSAAGSVASIRFPEIKAGIYMLSIQTQQGLLWKKILIE